MIKKLEPGGTQTHISHKLGQHLNLLDHWVHSFQVSAFDTQEHNVVSQVPYPRVSHGQTILVEGNTPCKAL